MNWDALWGAHLLLAEDIRQEDPYQDARLTLLFHSPALTLAQVKTQRGIRLEVPHTSAHIYVCMPEECRFNGVINGFEATATTLTPLVISPGMQISLRLEENTSLRVLKIDNLAVSRAIEAALGRAQVTPVRFETSLDLTNPQALRWIYAAQLLDIELDQSDALLHTSLGANSLAHLFISALLSLVPSNYSAQLQQMSSESTALRRALAFIDANLGVPIMVEDVANAAMVSVRTLQQTFKESTGMTISHYIRASRLDHIHQELTECRLTPTPSVSQLGLRWGIPHAGRLSRWYKERFGVTPSQTIAQREQANA